MDIRLRLGQEGILDVVSRRQKWKNRLEEMNDDSTTKKAFKGELEGKRPRGRQQTRWIDNCSVTDMILLCLLECRGTWLTSSIGDSQPVID